MQHAPCEGACMLWPSIPLSLFIPLLLRLQEVLAGRLMEARRVPYAVRYQDISFQVLGCGRPALVLEMDQYDCK